MGKFNFRLESLLQISINREEEAKKEFAKASGKLKQGQEDLLALCHQHTEALKTLVESQKDRVSINQLISNHQYCQFLKKEVEKKQRLVIELENKVEKAKKELQENIKQRKILEKLKEKQYSDYLLEEQKKLQNTLDEIASNLYYNSAGGF